MEYLNKFYITLAENENGKEQIFNSDTSAKKKTTNLKFNKELMQAMLNSIRNLQRDVNSDFLRENSMNRETKEHIHKIVGKSVILYEMEFSRIADE